MRNQPILVLLLCFFAIIASQANNLPNELRRQQKSCGDHERLHAFIFFGKWPSEDVLGFAAELAEKTAYSVYIVPDDKDFHWPDADKHPKVRIRHVTKSQVMQANFTHASSYTFAADAPPDKAIWANDRALTLAASDEFSEQYCRIWLIEDDVFIPSVEAAVHVNRLARDSFDYISTSDVQAYPWPYWSNWRRFKKMLTRFPIPSEYWRHNMANAVAMSPKFLAILRSLAAANGQLLFFEAMYPTLACALNRTHLKLDELHFFPKIRGTVNFEWEDIAKHKLWWYHPMKDTALRKVFRQRIRDGASG